MQKRPSAVPGISGGGVRLWPRRRGRWALVLLALTSAIPVMACGGDGTGGTGPPSDTTAVDTAAFLDDIEARTFDYFWQTTDAATGLAPDRWPDPPFASIAAVGFALTAYPVGVERGWVARADAATRTLATLRFLASAPSGPGTSGVSSYHGFFYHFLDMANGERFGTTELSTIDTALLMAGVLAAGQYFDGAGGDEVEIRALADSLYRRVEWDWATPRPPLIALAWSPEGGFNPYDWVGYNEAMILYILALGSPTHPIDGAAWPAWTAGYDWVSFHGQLHVNFAPLFGHQYSHAWIDFRGIQDAYMRDHGIDYFENSRRAAVAQQAYAIDNPGDWRGYGEAGWGLTASDGPGELTATVGGGLRTFHGYWARGAAATAIRDDGTLAPTAAAASVPFAPDMAVPAMWDMARRYGNHLLGQYGFLDAFNPTLTDASVSVSAGGIVPGVGWFDDQYLGIDQGPIVLMLENHRSGLVWALMRDNPYILRGLCRAGFGGGWLEGRC